MSHHPRYILPRSILTCLAVVLAGGCHPDVDVKESGSATAEKDLFGETETDASDSGIPTTSDSDATPPIDPQDACELHPTPDFPGVRYECGGSFAGGLVFDYYGAKDIPLHGFLPCQDLSKWYPKEPGYVYTCFASLKEQHFGSQAEKASLSEVQACCLEGSPDEAVGPFCRIDAAQDLCVSASDQLNQLRKELPLVPKLKEINQQLENLNYFLAASETQSECAFTFAKGLVATGDITKASDTLDWKPAAKWELDSDDGWPWFRELDVNLNEFILEELSATTSVCLDPALNEPQTGVLADGTATVSDDTARGETSLTGGDFAFRQGLCSGPICDFQLDALRLTAAPFTFAGRHFHEITAELTSPAKGRISGETVRIPGHRVELALRFQVSSEASGDEVHALTLRANGDVTASLSPDSHFAVRSLRLANWPVEIELATKSVQAR